MSDLVNMKRYFLVLSFLILVFTDAFASIHYVSPSGSTSGTGSLSSPFDLQTALNQPSTVLANDTIYLLDGIYQGHFTSNLNGQTNQYIYVLQFPGHRATIEDTRQFASGATLQINGSWTIYKDFEIRNNSTDRSSSGPLSFRPMGIQMQAPNSKLINLIIHDVGHGVGFWKEAENSEIYGCLIYNCGTENHPGSYITHGHGIYSQNDVGLKQIRNNFIFNQYGFGIHLYPNPGHVKGYLLEGNCLFKNGKLTNDTFRLNNILANTYSPYLLESIQVKNNLTYDDGPAFVYNSLFQSDVFLGATDVVGKKLTVEDNVFASNNRAGLAIINWDSTQVKRNILFHKNGVVGASVATSSSNTAYDWDNNFYYTGTNPNSFSFESSANLDFSAWQLLTGFDANSIVVEEDPIGYLLDQQVNEYEQGRSSLVIYNWDTLNQISVDLSGTGLNDGQTFSIVDAQNFYGTPLYVGTYNATSPQFQLPLPSNLTAEQPLGFSSTLQHTAPFFYSLIVLPYQFASLQEQSESEISVYPNPTKGKLVLNFPDKNVEVHSFQIVDVNNKTVLIKNTTESDLQIDLSDLQNGIYFVIIESNQSILTKKIILLK